MVKHNAIVDILDGGRRGKDGQALCALQKYHLDISKIQHHPKLQISAMSGRLFVPKYIVISMRYTIII